MAASLELRPKSMKGCGYDRISPTPYYENRFDGDFLGRELPQKSRERRTGVGKTKSYAEGGVPLQTELSKHLIKARLQGLWQLDLKDLQAQKCPASHQGFWVETSKINASYSWNSCARILMCLPTAMASEVHPEMLAASTVPCRRSKMSSLISVGDGLCWTIVRNQRLIPETRTHFHVSMRLTEHLKLSLKPTSRK